MIIIYLMVILGQRSDFLVITLDNLHAHSNWLAYQTEAACWVWRIGAPRCTRQRKAGVSWTPSGRSLFGHLPSRIPANKRYPIRRFNITVTFHYKYTFVLYPAYTFLRRMVFSSAFCYTTRGTNCTYILPKLCCSCICSPKRVIHADVVLVTLWVYRWLF